METKPELWSARAASVNQPSASLVAQPRFTWWWVAALAAVLFFTRLGAPQLWDRDEPRNARCASEMLARHDWVVPTFNGQLRTHKPILLYWLMISAYQCGGITEFTARFWSAALSVGTVALTCAIGCRLGNRRVGIWSGIVLSTTLMFNVAAHAATPDASLIFCSTLALFCLTMTVDAHAWQPAVAGGVQPQPLAPARNTSWWHVAAFAAMGLGVLAKGPVGFVLPFAIWVAFLGWALASTSVVPRAERTAETSRFAAWLARCQAICLPRCQPRHWLAVARRAHPLLAVVVVLLVAAPWYYLVGARTNGVWLREFFLEHNVGRAMHSMEGHRGNPLIYYPAAILVGFFPWSVLALPVALWTARRRPSGEWPLANAFLLSWVGVIVAAFSCASTKLPSYVTPTYPALALLCGDALAHAGREQREWARRWFLRATCVLGALGLLITLGLPVAATWLLPGEAWLGIVGLVPLVGSILMWRAFRRDAFDAGQQRLAATAVLLSLAIWGLIVPQVSRHQQIQSLVRHLHEAPAVAPQVASLGVQEPSWVFYAAREIPLLDLAAPATALEILNTPGGQLIVTDRIFTDLQSRWPADTRVVATVPYFLKDERLLLLERDVTARQPTQSWQR